MKTIVASDPIETSRVYVRDNRIFIAHRFVSGGERYQVEVPAVLISRDVTTVTRTAPYFDSERESAA